MEPMWSIVVGQKELGLWRPPITLKVWIEGNRDNPLNINPSYNFPTFRDRGWFLEGPPLTCNCSYYTGNTRNLPQTPLRFFQLKNARNFAPLYCECCDRNALVRLPEIGDVFKEWSFTLYPEWRPGEADYSDYVEWIVENLLQPCVDEFNHRLQEALSSPATESYTYTSKQAEMEKAGGVKITRRLRV